VLPKQPKEHKYTDDPINIIGNSNQSNKIPTFRSKARKTLPLLRCLWSLSRQRGRRSLKFNFLSALNVPHKPVMKEII